MIHSDDSPPSKNKNTEKGRQDNGSRAAHMPPGSENVGQYGAPCWLNNECQVREEGLTLTPEQEVLLKSWLCHGLESGLQAAELAIPGHPGLRVGLGIAARYIGQICDEYDARNGLNQSDASGG